VIICNSSHNVFYRSDGNTDRAPLTGWRKGDLGLNPPPILEFVNDTMSEDDVDSTGANDDEPIDPDFN